METEDIGELFSACDRDSKGYLNLDEFSHLCSELQLEASQIRKIFDLLDVNQNGQLEKSEFLKRFVSIADGYFESKLENEQENYPTHIRSSTPVPEESNMTPRSSWDDILDKFGHVMFALTSYESLNGFHKLIEGDVFLQQQFQKLVSGFIKDVQRLKDTVTDLETSLERITKQSEDQLALLEEEMEAQIRTREELIRKTEQEKFNLESDKQKEKYEQQIAKLQEAVDNLKKVDDRLSGISPYSKEMENLREKLREVTADNSTLRTRLNEAETNVTILQSKISALQLELQEKMLDFERESDAVTMALSEQESMSRQVNSLYSDNRRLRDSNVDLRAALDSNSAAYRRISTRLNKSQSSSTLGAYSAYTHPYGRSLSSRGASPAASYLDVQALAECDPGLKMTLYSGDDDTEIDFSLKSSLDGASFRKNSTFERDSGVGTLRTEYDSDTEMDPHLGAVRGVVGPPYAYAPYPPSYPYRRSFRTSKNESNKNRLPLDDVTDHDVSEEDSDRTPVERRSKHNKKRKVINPGLVAVKGPLYKVILCGDANVGKSSFILRFCQDEFRTHTRSTLGLDFRVKNVRLSDSEVITVQLWDTAGQERFRSISTSYFRKADGVILVYDVTCPSSFINVRDWMERISESVPDGTPVLICGNKVDLRTTRDGEKVVYPTEGAQLAANYGVLFMETSASSGMNIKNGMDLLARHLVTSKKKVEETGAISELNQKLKKTNCSCVS